MSIDQYSLRKVSFPASSDIEQVLTTNYLAYMPGYSTTIALFKDIENPKITRTFKPKEMLEASEITEFDINSPNYNVPTIDKYIKDNIFVKIPLTTTITTHGTVSNPITDYIISTIGTIYEANADTNTTKEIVNKLFTRSSKLYWVELASNNGIDYTLIPNFMTFSSETMGFGAWEFHYDGLATDYSIGLSNLVVDSLGHPWIVQSVNFEGLYYFNLSSYNNGSGVLSITSVDRTVILNGDANIGAICNLLIDENNIKYLVTGLDTFSVSNVYQIDNDNQGMTLLFSSASSIDFRNATYNIEDSSFIIQSFGGNITKYSKTGDIITSQDLSNGNFGDSVAEFATGGTLAETVVLNQEIEMFAIGPYLVGDGFEYAEAIVNKHYSDDVFIDGPANTGEVSTTPIFKTFPVNYDTRSTDIYFIDRLILV